MTQGDLAAYWGAIAQVIPVVALAFVIEARVIVRRMSKKTAYRYRGLRIRWSITFFVLALLLTLSEYAALQSLALDPDRPLVPMDAVYYWLSLLSVAASLLIVITLPVSSLISASLGDVIRWVELHVPWGRAQRLRRDIIRQLESLDALVRRGRDNRLDALLMCAAVLLDETLDVEAMQRIFVSAMKAEPYSHLLDPTGELQELLKSDPHQELWAYKVTRRFYDDLARDGRDIRKLRKQVRGQLRRIEKITRVDSPEFVKLQRANMAVAAKMP